MYDEDKLLDMKIGLEVGFWDKEKQIPNWNL